MAQISKISKSMTFAPQQDPLLILVDLQREFMTDGSFMQIVESGPALQNCRRLLAHARSRGWPIAHVRWVHQANRSGRASEFTDWIEGVRPQASEMVFEKEFPSCYTDQAFAKMMDAGSGNSAVVAGLAGSVSCLATLIEGSSRAHKLVFAADASASHGIRDVSEKQAHEVAVFIASQFVPVVDTLTLIRNAGVNKSWESDVMV